MNFSKFLIGAQLAYKINPIKFYKGMVKSQHCQNFISSGSKDVKMTKKGKKKKKKKKKMATQSIFSIL